MRYYLRPLAACILLASAGLHAQTSGELRGLVRDAAGQPVANARVSARSGSSGARTQNTETDGRFDFASLPVGQYTVEADADGFKSYSQQYVDVSLGHVVELSIQLEPGDSTKVLALETPLVERSSSQLGGVVSADTVVGLPLNTRDTYQLLQLQPGVQSQQGYDLYAGSDNPGVVSVNGGRSRANNFHVNGGDANDIYVGIPAVQPAPDSIQEFRVLTSGFDAENGRNSGSIVNVVTKSGSNEFHGNAFEFFRNRALNTRGFFDSTTPKFNQNQFGGTLGGPVLKNRSFFFFSVEQRQIRRGVSSDLVAVPSPAERSGDFSDGGPFTGTLHDEYVADALRGRPGCAHAAAARGGSPIQAGAAWADIFPGSKIPSQCFDATAADLLAQYVPLPNTGAFFQAAPVKRESAFQPTGRLDQTLPGSTLLTFYYYFDDASIENPFATYGGIGADLPGFGSDFRTRVQQFNLGATTSIGASVVNEARFSVFREGQRGYNQPHNAHLVQESCKGVAAEYCFSDPASPELGIRPGLGSSHEGVPFIRVNGLFSIGNSQAGEHPQVGNTFHAADNVSVVHGAHRLKFGADARRQRFDQTLHYNVSGAFTFNAGGVNDLGAASAMPNYLLGLPTSYSQGSAQSENVRSTALGLYAQDSWSLRPNLTLNAGLRWELTTPMRDTGNRIQTFRPGQATSVFPCRLDPAGALAETFGTTDCAPGSAGESVFPLGLVVPGDAGVPDGLTATYYKSFAPRIGLAWSPSGGPGWLRKLHGGAGKSSIRAGWGMFYNPIEQLVLEQFSAEPPFGGSTSLSNPMFNTPFQGQNGAVNANPFHGILTPARGNAVDWSMFRPILLYGEFEPRLRSQYSESYNFTIQRQLRKDMLLQIGYLGTQGHRLLATHDLNYGLAQPCLDLNRLSEMTGDADLSCGPFSADSAYTVPAGRIPAGFTLHLPYGPVRQVTGPNPNPITLVGLRPYSSPLCNPLTGKGCAPDGVPVFGSIFSEDTIANSSYNSLQVSFEKRAFSGLAFQLAYTWSKSLDNASSFESVLNPLDYASSRSLSLFNAPHRLVASYVWNLPRVKVSGPLKQVLNGWSLSGIMTMQSGFPVPISSSDDLELMSSADFTAPGLPDRVAPFRKLDPRNPLHLAFDPASFAQPAELGVIGNSPRSVCCGPGINNIDFSLMKNYTVRERFTAQFRAEVFNGFNHAQFTKVDGNISDGDPAAGGTFGTVLGAREPRLMQFALKLIF